MFERDLDVAAKIDATYAQRLRSAISVCFLDTNAFSLADVPPEERLLIGARTTGRMGARHNPDVAREALEESKDEVERLFRRHSVVFIIGTGGKGTGAGTIFPLSQMVRQQKKLLVPIFVRPSFERHEVDKRRYDHALTVSQQFDRAQIRLMEILNDRGYDEGEPRPQAKVWERMNLPIARALRGLMYVLWDLSQVDPSDLSTMFAGYGRLRIAFAEIDPPEGLDPTDQQIDTAIRECCENPYYAFTRPIGTSLVCIQGDWSNVVDAKIKGGLAASAVVAGGVTPYVPLYARAPYSPRPWGVTAVFSEHTGVHAPIEVEWDWSMADAATARGSRVPEPPARPAEVITMPAPRVTAAAEPAAAEHAGSGDAAVPFATLSEFAVAVNRSDPRALALAGNGATTALAFDGLEVRKLLGTLWFRAVVPRLSSDWRGRILETLVNTVSVQNHTIRIGRQQRNLSDCSFDELQAFARTSTISDTMRPEIDLLITIGRLWGAEALSRVEFTGGTAGTRGRLAGLMG
jgi:cell division GTPase FtsZ